MFNPQEGDRIIAYDEEGTVRGVGELQYFAEIDDYVVSMLIYGEGDEEISFKYFVANTNNLYQVNGGLIFTVNKMIGTVSDLYDFHIDDEKVALVGENVVVYPNPIEDLVNIELLQKHSGQVSIKLYTLSGVEVMAQSFTTSQGMNHIEIDISQFRLPAGLYTMKFQSQEDSEVQSVNVIVK